METQRNAWENGLRLLLVSLVGVAGIMGILATNGVAVIHGALKVAVGLGGHPLVVTNDGAVYQYNGTVWDRIEGPGTADDLELCGTFLVILTRPDAQGIRQVKSRTVTGGTWETYPVLGSPPGAVSLKQVACDGNDPIVLADAPNYGVYRYDRSAQRWNSIHDAATWISVENSRLFYTYPTTTAGNVWTRDVSGGPYQRWGDQMVAERVAGDANGFPWAVVNATTNPIYKWDTTHQKWTFGPSSGPVYDIDIQSYVRMFIVSDPQVAVGGYTVYSHDLYSGGWTTYSLPSY